MQVECSDIADTAKHIVKANGYEDGELHCTHSAAVEIGVTTYVCLTGSDAFHGQGSTYIASTAFEHLKFLFPLSKKNRL